VIEADCESCGHHYRAPVQGGHRVLCGDATRELDVAAVLGGAHVDAVVTDPPYGVGLEYRSFEDSIENVEKLIEGIMPTVLAAPCAAITSGVPAMWSYPRPAWLLAWVHPAGMGSGPWGFTCLNPILVYGRDPYLAKGLGRHPDTLVLDADREDASGHPAIKPAAVWAWLVERMTTKAGQVVLDLFGGAGTTAIACEQLGRRGHLIELDPVYVDVAVRRWERFTGRRAVKDAGS
jgi:site-specific DNA-methyltransferase (adenine-specific)